MRTKQKGIGCFLLLALIFGTVPVPSLSAAKKVSLSNRKVTITKGTKRRSR